MRSPLTRLIPGVMILVNFERKELRFMLMNLNFVIMNRSFAPFVSL